MNKPIEITNASQETNGQTYCAGGTKTMTTEPLVIVPRAILIVIVHVCGIPQTIHSSGLLAAFVEKLASYFMVT